MAGLGDLQGQLKQLRGKRRSAEVGHLEARERLRSAVSAQAPEDELAQLNDQVGSADDARRHSIANELAVLAVLEQLGDPSELVGQLSDDTPFLLFPVRLETRFKEVEPGRHQLWLRIFPDDCQVETFTEIMSRAELRSVEDFWIGYWKAGGIEAGQRAAWRGLVASHGSGRAAWLVERHAPAGTPPVKAKPEDVILVVHSDLEPAAAERPAADAFWVATWRAGNDANARAAARAALVAAVGESRARELEERWRPANLEDEPPPPHKRADVAVSVAAIDLPPTDALVTSQSSWLEAPRVSTLPDRFVAIGMRGDNAIFTKVGRPVPSVLHVGPDPTLPEAEQIRSEDGELVVNDELRWLTDFDAAVERGMGMRIDVDDRDAIAGFERLLVLGLRLSADADQGAADLERLLNDHKRGKNGLSVLPQGTPTNNTGDESSGYSWLDDPEGSFDRVFGKEAGYAFTADPLERRDGEWLAEALGIKRELFHGVAHAEGTDQGEARAMNTALWPATWGYFLEEMLSVPEETVYMVRRYFIDHVSGRGAVPAIRVGTQPYGILPATVWSRLDVGRLGGTTAIAGHGGFAFLPVLQAILKRLDQEWWTAAEKAVWAEKPGLDPEQALLDVLGLHPASVEYHQRYARSLAHFFNYLRFLPFGDLIADALTQAFREARRNALEQLGISEDAELPIVEKIFSDPANLLDGPLIDDTPLSETNPIRPYAASGANYVGWLSTATIDQIRRQDLGPGKPAPRALLYSLLRHGTMLAYWEASIELLLSVITLHPQIRREPDFLHIAQSDAIASKFEPLYRVEPAATGGEQVMVGEYLDRAEVLANQPEAQRLAEHKRALVRLADVPTARLERLFAEHVDLSSYRLDAWKLGLVHVRLAEQREKRGDRGVYLGAFGWLEDVRREPRTLTEVELPDDLDQVFATNGAPLVRDSTNAGHMHAPSVDQAAAAAILRNGYITQADPQDVELLSVNLSSERVRTALDLLHGQRRGQPLAALLGYQLERGLHDRIDPAVGSLDQFILGLRQRFPLVANQLESTKEKPDVPVEQLAARNVVDGLALAEHIRKTEKRKYPFGIETGALPGQLLPATTGQAGAIDAEVARMLDAEDALADLMVAESVYQVVRGAHERAAAAADVVGRGHFPPEPEVIQTPRSGLTAVHRVAIHLDAGATAPGAPPRVAAEPALAKWVAERLPAPDDVQCAVMYTDAAGTEKPAVVSQAQLGLAPLDLLHVFSDDPRQAGTEIDDRIEHHVRTTLAPHPGARVRIEYTKPVPKLSFFELGPLVRDLKALVLRSRALEAADMAVPTSETAVPAADTEGLAKRVDEAIKALELRKAPLAAAIADAATGTDAYVKQAAGLLLAVGRHGVPQTGTRGLWARINEIHDQAAAKAAEVVERWTARAAEFDSVMATVASLPTDAEKQDALTRAERLVSTDATTPVPAPAAYEPIVTAKRAAFGTVLQGFESALSANVTGLGDFLDQLPPLLAELPKHDHVPFDREREQNDIDPELEARTALRDEAKDRLAAVLAEIEARVPAATQLVEDARANAQERERTRMLVEAARKVLGDDACVLPRFTLFPEHAADLAASSAAADSLVQHLKANGRDFPVDDWLYGVARAREKLAHWESATVLVEALGKQAPALTPLQLPYRDGDAWAALELADDYVLDGEKLLYTAALGGAFDPSTAQCGLLVDEWTEIVPAAEETTGLAFHFDQPNSEPPQAMLLVTPPKLTGAWRWDDLVDTLGETLESARLRIVEPQHLETGPLGQFLPATMMAVTFHLLTIATDLQDSLLDKVVD